MTLFQFLVIMRWIYFAAVFVLFGAPLFWFYAGREVSSGSLLHVPRSLCATLHLLRIAVPVVALSGIAWLVGILVNMTGGFSNAVDPETLHLFFFATQFGPVAILRLVLFVVIVVITILPMRHRAWFCALSIIAALLLVSQAWLGHAAEGGAGVYGTVMIITYSLHLLAGAAWVGGLPPLLFALVELHQCDLDDTAARTLAILSRYSLMAMIAVTIIVISGAANAGFRVAGAFDRLFWTGYGEVLVTKLIVVALMLGLAYFNRFVAMPRLRIAVLKGGAASRQRAQIARLRTSIGVELVLGLLVLGIAAVLGITPPPQ
jgi:putative copper resistance protein D